MSRFQFLFTLAVTIGTAFSGPVRAQSLFTEWNFNGGSATTVPGGSSSPTPSMGIGTASLVGGVTGAASFGSGVVNGGSSDPVTTAPSNYGWQTTTYAAAGTENGLRGVQFGVSTVGFTGVRVEYDLRHSNTSSRYEQFQYSTDGTNFINFGAPADGNAGDTWFNNRTIDLSSITAADNNPNFAIRVVAAFAPSTSDYVASNGASTYAAGGTWRFDMVQFYATPVPEPTSLIALTACGALGVAGVRRRFTRKS